MSNIVVLHVTRLRQTQYNQQNSCQLQNLKVALAEKQGLQSRTYYVTAIDLLWPHRLRQEWSDKV
jgi:hypothetical protein